ncbi:cytochrome P450 81E8 [Rosa chinensis]|uniref:cytochrome P450 81E8 n=1 Tax=Rosa chinensis TaxID=74649 RepID=UPI000D08B0F8|nr:cytochrome P450 81E8 [Rosa chinensis]
MGDPLSNSLALFVFALLLIKLFITNNRSQKYKNLPPSPPCLPIIGHLHLLRQPIHRTLESLSAKYGRIQLLRWGSRRVILAFSPSIVEECFTKHDIVFSNRPLLLAGKHFHYNYTTVVVAPYGDLWRNLRCVMTLEIFSSSRVAMFSSIRQGDVRFLLDQISKSCSFGMTKVELKSKCIHLPFNVMTMMILGKRYYGEHVGHAEEAKNFREAVTDAIELNSSANLGDFLPFLQWGDVSGLEKKMVSVMAKMDSFLQAMVSDCSEILSLIVIKTREEEGSGSYWSMM